MSPKSNETCHFLRIPLETRFEIYRYLLVPRTCCWVNGKIDEDEPDYHVTAQNEPNNRLINSDYDSGSDSGDDSNDGSSRSSDDDSDESSDGDATVEEGNTGLAGGSCSGIGDLANLNEPDPGEVAAAVEDRLNFWGKHTSILRTCRQIYSEAAPLLYAETTLILDPRDIPGQLRYGHPSESWPPGDGNARFPPILIERSECPDLFHDEHSGAHFLYPGKNLFGRLPEGENRTRIIAPSILDEHCSFTNVNDVVTLVPEAGAAVKVNGIRIERPKRLRSGSFILLGASSAFRFQHIREIDLVGILEFQTFAKFKKIRFDAVYDFSSWLVQMFRDGDSVIPESVKDKFIKHSHAQFLFKHVVEFLSQSPSIESLQISLLLDTFHSEFYEDYVLDYVESGLDLYERDLTDVEAEEKVRNLNMANRALLSLLLESGVLKPLEALSNVKRFAFNFQVFQFVARPQSPPRPQIAEPRPCDSAMMYSMKRTIEQNWRAKHLPAS